MGMREEIQGQTISQLSLRPYVAVTAETTVRQTVQKMREEEIGAAIVVDQSGKAVGLFTEKLLVNLLATDPSHMDEQVSHHMSRHLISLRKTDTIAKLILTMQRHNLRWVCLTDEAGRPVALTGMRGVIEHVADYFPRLVKVQPFNLNISVEQREGA